MRKLVAVIFLLSVFASCQKGHDILRINGIEYQVFGTYDNGTAKSFYRSGKLQSYVPIVNGKLNGEFITLYENQKLKSTYTQKDDELHGPYKTYFETGELYEQGEYIHGRKTGTITRFNKDGSKRAEMVYEGKDMKSLTEYTNGKAEKLQFTVTCETNYLSSMSTYKFKVTPEPRLVRFYVKKNGQDFRIKESYLQITREAGQHFTFTTKGITLKGNAFMLSQTK